MKRFLEKVAVNPALGEKLSKLKEEYEKEVLALAWEAGFEVTWEDFGETVQGLSDEDVMAASGGYNPRPSAGSFV